MLYEVITEQWLATAEARPSDPPDEVLAHLADVREDRRRVARGGRQELRHDGVLGRLLVITSYSIHYTKLYDFRW